MQVSNKRLVDTSGPDFYPTPTWATEALLAYEPLNGTIWEPACGNGAISKTLEQAGHVVRSTDLHDHGYGEPELDFLAQGHRADIIITNPPYNIGESFVLTTMPCCPDCIRP